MIPELILVIWIIFLVWFVWNQDGIMLDDQRHQIIPNHLGYYNYNSQIRYLNNYSSPIYYNDKIINYNLMPIITSNRSFLDLQRLRCETIYLRCSPEKVTLAKETRKLILAKDQPIDLYKISNSCPELIVMHGNKEYPRDDFIITKDIVRMTKSARKI